jgi:hypothetical protein
MSESTNDWDPHGVLTARDAFLESIGFDSYEIYLQSDLWNWIRSNLLLGEFSHLCCCCGTGVGLVWHHRSYSPAVMVGNFSNSPFGSIFEQQLMFPIVRICLPCHSCIHLRRPPEWDQTLKQRLNDHERWIEDYVSPKILDRFFAYRATLVEDVIDLQYEWTPNTSPPPT